MISANAKWREFKTKLTSKYVFGRLGSPDLNIPPSKYPFIKSIDWSAFVISRMTDDFKESFLSTTSFVCTLMSSIFERYHSLLYFIEVERRTTSSKSSI